LKKLKKRFGRSGQNQKERGPGVMTSEKKTKIRAKGGGEGGKGGRGKESKRSIVIGLS